MMQTKQPQLPSNIKDDQLTCIKVLRTYPLERIQIDAQLLEDLLNCTDILFLHLKVKSIKMQMSTDLAALPTPQLIRAQFIPFLIQLIENNITSELTYDATWILMNIASGTKSQIEELINFGCLDLFLSLLDSNYEDIIEQGIWGLANFVGEGPEVRTELLKKNLLMNIIIADQKINNKESLLWLINNVTKGPPLPYRFLKAQFLLIPVLGKYFIQTTYQKNLKENFQDALRSLNNIIEIDDSIEVLLNVIGMLEAITELLSLGDHDIQSLALDILERISTGTDKQIQSLLDVGCEKIILNLVREDKNLTLMKQAVRTFANICTGDSFSAHTIASDQSIVSELFKIISNNQRTEIVKESLFVLSNILENAPEQDVNNLYKLGLLDLFKNHIIFVSNQMQSSIILTGFQNLFERKFKWAQELFYDLFQQNTEWLQPLLLKYNISIAERTKKLISQVRASQGCDCISLACQASQINKQSNTNLVNNTSE